MKKEKKETTLKDIAQAIKETARGKIALFLFVLGIVEYLSEGRITGLFLGIYLVAILLMASASSSLHMKQKRSDDDKMQVIKSTQTKCVGDYLYVNEKMKTFCLPTEDFAQFYFSDLLDFEAIENGDVVWGGSVLGTAVGAMAGGLTGALLGASASKANEVCRSLQIKLSVNSIDHPNIYITLIDHEVRKNWDEYKKAVKAADEIVGVLKVIKARNER